MSARRLSAAPLLSLDRNRAVPGAFERLAGMLRLWRTRSELAELDRHLLKDVGVTPAAAAHEAARLPWDQR